MTDLIPSAKMSPVANILVNVITAIIILMWAFALYAYFTLPDIIPTHFGIEGKPDDYGDKSTFLFLALIFCITPVIFLLLVKYRFVLINRYPYLINLPGFFLYIEKIEYQRRAYWYNKYFEIFLWLGVAISFYLFAIQLMIYKATIDKEFNSFFLVIILVLPFLFLIPFLIALISISNKIRDEAKKSKV